jgi:hypothetical protein
MANFTQRMMGAARLDVRIYEEVEADKTALQQAMAVVVLSSLAAGIGSIGKAGVMGLVTGTLASLIAWFIWAFLTYLIGTKLLPEPQTQSDMSELLRTIGFSSSPGLLKILGFLPVLGGLIMVAASIWMLIAMVIAVRQALDYTSTWRAVGVCIIGWIVLIVVTAFLGAFALA